MIPHENQATLADQPNQTRCQIRELAGEAAVVLRLLEIGFIRGQEVLVRGRAPFGEPILVEIHGATIALRKREAQCILV